MISSELTYAYAALLDLYGNALRSGLLELAYRNEPDYFEAVGQLLRAFSAAAGYPEERMLGLAVSMQSIPDARHEKRGICVRTSLAFLASARGAEARDLELVRTNARRAAVAQ